MAPRQSRSVVVPSSSNSSGSGSNMKDVPEAQLNLTGEQQPSSLHEDSRVQASVPIEIDDLKKTAQQQKVRVEITRKGTAQTAAVGHDDSSNVKIQKVDVPKTKAMRIAIPI